MSISNSTSICNFFHFDHTHLFVLDHSKLDKLHLIPENIVKRKGKHYDQEKVSKEEAMDLPEIFQQPEGRSDFYLDELALPAPKLAFPSYMTQYKILEGGVVGKEKQYQLKGQK
jgi:hypothetical protein